MQQQKPTSSTQTSHQQMAGPSMNASSSSTSQSNQNQDDHYHYTTSSDTQLTDSQQMTSAAITSASQPHIAQNGYSTSISNSTSQSTPTFNQSHSISGAQTAWRGSSTVTYTPSATMQPDSRPVNQPFCESLSIGCG